MSRLVALALVVATLAACSSPCMRIQQRICACQYQTSGLRRTCETNEENQQSLDPPTADELTACESLDESCAAILAEKGCSVLEVDEGKRACGLSGP